MLTGMRETFISSLLSVNNWWQIADGSSYFANFAQTANSAFKHIYFLSIEGQFTVILALLMLILSKKDGKKLPVIVLLLLSLASALAMARLFTAADPTRVYYGTDTRLFALLIGAALAFADTGSLKLKREFTYFLAFIAVTAIAAALFFLPDKLAFIYQGGMYLFSLVTALLIWLLASQNLGRNSLLSNKLLKYLGARSYAIYLWQLPVFVAAENWGINGARWYNLIWELALIIALSEISHRFVERPFGKMSFENVKKFFSQNLRSMRKLPIYALFPVGLAGLVIIFSSPSQSADIKGLEKKIASSKLAAEAHNRALIAQKPSHSTGSKNEESTVSTSSSSISSSSPAASQPAAKKAPENRKILGLVNPATYPMAAVGDSVMLDVSERLQQAFPLMYLDGQVGRQADTGASVLQSLPDGILANARAILIDLGINGTISDADIAAVMKVASGRPVFWVNVRVPRSWEAADNATLAAAAAKYPNLHVLDWYSTAINHPEYFVSDEVHLTSDGITAYVQLVGQAVMKQG
ncbi:acyltransferase family protein [Lactovum odontotermitis]